MKDVTPGLELPNGMKPTNYPQEFVQVENVYKVHPTNEQAKKVHPDETMKMVYGS
jgi:hypothetical protein